MRLLNGTRQALARVLFALLATGVLCTVATAAEPGTENRPLRVLHVMSYHSGWDWNKEQLRGFQDALKGLDVEYRVVEMDTQRRSSEEWMQQVAAQAIDTIEQWKPDRVYTNDDNAQQYVVTRYVGSDMPFVFSGVNASPDKYGFVGSPNVTGVLEIEHSLQTVRLLRQIVPGTRRIALIVDEGATWPGVIRRMQQALESEPDLEVVSVDKISTFDEYKAKVTAYQGKVDALGVLGVFTFKDEQGKVVPYQDVLRWTTENSRIPDFSFWGDRIKLGTLVAVRVSGYQQGFVAGEKARAILEGRRKASEIPMEATIKGEPMLSLARAKALGLKIPSSLLLNTRVEREFSWGS